MVLREGEAQACCESWGGGRGPPPFHSWGGQGPREGQDFSLSPPTTPREKKGYIQEKGRETLQAFSCFSLGGGHGEINKVNTHTGGIREFQLA